MNTFEYITVLVFIVVGLAIADIANSLHRLLSAGGRVDWDWISPVAALLVLLELFNLWWKWRGFTGSTLGQVVPCFGVLLMLFLAAAASLPDEVPPGGINLRTYFEEKRRHFWAVYAAYVAGWIGLQTVQLLQDGMPVGQGSDKQSGRLPINRHLRVPHFRPASNNKRISVASHLGVAHHRLVVVAARTDEVRKAGWARIFTASEIRTCEAVPVQVEAPPT